MSKDILPLSSLSDEELLTATYLNKEPNPLATELARRLEHALDCLSAANVTMEKVLDKYGSDT